MSAAGNVLVELLPRVAREGRILRLAVALEMRKQAAFRAGFLVREVLRGLERLAVWVFVYAALFASAGSGTLRGYTLPDMIAYLVLSTMIVKLLFHERGLDLSEQIFDGYITKFLVLPLSCFGLAAARFVQYTMLQVGVAVVFWTLGAVLLPQWWPQPVGVVASLQATTLVLLGSWCFLLAYFVIHSLAFWLDVVWALLHMTRMLASFVMGEIVPVALMPQPLIDAFRWLFPYWALSGPIEILMGRQGTPDFLTGLGVLACWAIVLQVVAAVVWRRGLRRYGGVGA